jgi:hypothetical protein
MRGPTGPSEPREQRGASVGVQPSEGRMAMLTLANIALTFLVGRIDAVAQPRAFVRAAASFLTPLRSGEPL